MKPSELSRFAGINLEQAIDELYGTEPTRERYEALQQALSEQPYYKPGKYE